MVVVVQPIEDVMCHEARIQIGDLDGIEASLCDWKCVTKNLRLLACSRCGKGDEENACDQRSMSGPHAEIAFACSPA